MGYGVHRFKETIDDNLVCGVCGGVLEDAVLTPCGHSFCYQCLQTWLDNPNAGYTCPECRSRVRDGDARPILSVRNLIRGMEVSCEHCSRGCTASLKLDGMIHHISLCGFVPIECAGCRETVNRENLAEHQERCDALTAQQNSQSNHGLQDDEDDDDRPSTSISRYDWPHHDNHSCVDNPFCKHYFAEPYVSELTFRVTHLEIQLHKMKADLEIAASKNKKLERELRRTRDDLEEKRYQLLDHQHSEFDPDYEYGYTPKSISKLSCLISQHLTRKPSYIETNMIYNALKRCYDNYAKPSAYQSEIAARVTSEVSARATLECARDVHMLLATAYASNWFSEIQRVNVSHWIQAVSKIKY